MAVNVERILAKPAEELVVRYEARDARIYAVGVGVGSDPTDPRALRYVAEPQAVALPTLAAELGILSLNRWTRDPIYGVTWTRVVAGGQAVAFHGPTPAEASVRIRDRVVGVTDKGVAHGALLHHERSVFDLSSNTLIATIHATNFARADGGGGSAGRQQRPARRPPERTPDLIVELPTFPNQALLYCLTGDYGLIHWQPAAAQAAGFARPILHGQCTFGMFTYAILRQFCAYEPGALRSIEGRWSAIVYPGDTISVQFWKSGADIAFEAWVRSRSVRIFSDGFAQVGSGRA